MGKKARDLAGLAALGYLGFKLHQQGKGDSSKTDTGDETDRLANRTKGMSNEDYIKSHTKKAPEAKDANYGNEGRRTSMGVAPAPKTTTKAAPKTITTRKDPREAEAGMSRGTRSVPNDNYSNEGRSSAKPPSTVSSSAEGMKNYKPRRTPVASTVSSSEEGMKNYKPRRITPDAGAGRGFVNPPVPKPADPRSAEAGMSRGTRTTVPPFKGGQKGYDEAGNFMGGQRGFDEAGNPMKKGGMVKKAVKKMASGGMTSSASKRADGIATKGKTKCKMY